MMFTEGLDEKAIDWVNQRPSVVQKPRSPLVEKYPVDSVVEQLSLPKCSNFLSPKALPPVKYHLGLLGHHSTVLIDSDEDESVASVPEYYYANYSDTLEGGSDSDRFDKPLKGNCEEEVTSGESSSSEAIGQTDGRQKPTLVRALSKENLRVVIAAKDEEVETRFKADRGSATITNAQNHKQNGFPSTRVHLLNEYVADKFQEFGTPSAPPIEGNERDSGSLNLEGESKVNFSTEVSSDIAAVSAKVIEVPEGAIPDEGDMQVPVCQRDLASQIQSYNTSAQSAWQTFIAYDACFRLCLNAWARNCTEAIEFLRDECMALRDAFGLQTFLLHPRGQTRGDGRNADSKEGTNIVKGRKVIEQVEVEVKKVRVISQRRKLRPTSSYPKIYMQMGAEYVRQMSGILKSQINSLRATSSVACEETLSCLLQLKSSSEDALTESGSIACLKPGSGDSHVFYPESLRDAILIEVQDMNRVNQGRATIPISCLAESHEEVTKWFPIYLEDQGRAGKIQLSFSISHSSDKLTSTKVMLYCDDLQGGPVVETMIYDMVLDAALRAQNFNSKNLHIKGHWKWLLNEFADYYGVSDAYTKLRYLSAIMTAAAPTKECLELIYELLLSIMRARNEKGLTRQERSILLDCEDHINKLLATTFENYKSLDELSPTGLTDNFGQLPVSSAPALVPAVQIFTLLHDVLSQDAQNVLRNYLQTAAAKRCRRHMLETDEFVSSNCDAYYTDPMTISTAYLKMKILCMKISNEIQADIMIHNQHIFPSFIDLPNIAASLYSTELCKRIRRFLAACPPSKPSQHVAELLIATADFERNLESWNIRPAHGGLVSKDLFHNYIMVWVEDTRLQLLDLCKTEKVPCSGTSTNSATSPFVEHMYDQIRKNINEYEVVMNRWPQYLLSLENVVADIERAVFKSLEKQHNEILIPLRDGIPKILEKQVQKLTRRQSASLYVVPDQLGIFLNTVKRILEVLHPGLENILKRWATCLRIVGEISIFGEQTNGITVTLRKKYKKYAQAIVDKLVANAQANRTTRLKRILEETKEAEGESEIRERMQPLRLQLTDSIHNLHHVFSSRIFVAICRDYWGRMGQIVLSFLESRKENRIWYRGSGYALGILGDAFASEMQKLLGNSLQDKDLDPPHSVIEARSMLDPFSAENPL
ncbi:hypothetical protein Cni_G06859 [Canna indica]|uniref:Uncharacterized protein n=1 Tax=Canna indica TaxID=4628 RepID=A0AAQ3JXI9_9LILI|nr:hypothetical protein Cni_G06859 [Canna indica]